MILSPSLPIKVVCTSAQMLTSEGFEKHPRGNGARGRRCRAQSLKILPAGSAGFRSLWFSKLAAAGKDVCARFANQTRLRLLSMGSLWNISARGLLRLRRHLTSGKVEYTLLVCVLSHVRTGQTRGSNDPKMDWPQRQSV